MRTSIKHFGLATGLVSMTTLSAPVSAQQVNSAPILVYDASGSMWAPLDGGITKVEVAIPFEDSDQTTSAELAERASAATRAAPDQDDLPMVRATFRLPNGFPEVALWWSAVPFDPDMSPGEIEFRSVVEIVPDQTNDFVIPVFGPGEDNLQPEEQRGADGPIDPMNKIFVVSLSTEASAPQTDTVLEAGIDRGAAATAGNVFEHQAGTSIDPRGPYAAGQKTLFVVRRDESLESDELAIFAVNGPMSETTILSRNRDLGRSSYGSVTMPTEPGAYRIALLREGDRVVQGVAEITVELNPEMRFADWNAQAFPGRPLSVNLHGRMAYDDTIAILAPDGHELARASVFEAMTGYLRTPEGLSGAHQLVHIAHGPGGERKMASVDLDIGARGNTVDVGGASGAPVISATPKVLAGSRVEVSVRGAIPEKPILGFIRPNAAENQILETGQHFRPDMPSTTVSAPSQTGQWMMRLADQNLWRFAEVPVEVVDTLDEAESETVSGRDIKPRDGTWTVAIGDTALQGCPAMIADQIRNAGMQGRSNSRNITFANPFHPAPLMEDSAMLVDWEKTGPGSWQARLIQQSMGQMGSIEARYELTVVSETELREVSHFSLQLPAELMAVMGGGDDKCTSRTNATWNWQG